MSKKRLQVLFDEDELADLRVTAERHGLTLSAWVRQTLRRARREETTGDAGAKRAAIRAAMEHEFPTADIDRMLEEIDRGYVA